MIALKQLEQCVCEGCIVYFMLPVKLSRTALRLDAQGLVKRVHNTPIVANISLSVHPGEFVGLLGPSGAGKSTLLNALNGFRPADEGRVLLNGTNLYTHFDRFRSSIGYVPQEDIVHGSLSVYNALYYSALLRFPLAQDARRKPDKAAIKQRVKEVIHTLGLETQTKTKIKRLSGGQRKRVSLGLELLTSPPLLFLDEPTSGLDPGLEERMMTLFHALSREGRTIIMTTHIMESLQLLDLVALVVKGHLVFYGPPQLALKAFRVTEFSDIYTLLEQHNPVALAQQYRQSPVYKKYITARLSKRYKTEPIEQENRPVSTPPKTDSRPKPEQPYQMPQTQGADTSANTIEDELARLKARLEKE